MPSYRGPSTPMFDAHASLPEAESRGQSLQWDAMAEPLVLARLFAIPATHCEGHRAEPGRRDDFTAVDTVSLQALIETANRLVDSLQYFCLHLNESKYHIVLGLRLDRFVHVCRVAVPVGSEFANIPNLALNLIQQRALTRHERTPHLVAPLAESNVCDADTCASHVDHLSRVSERQAP
jgi:hypothetical protein